MEYKLTRLSSDEFRELIGQLHGDIIGDIDNGALVSCKFPNSSRWIKITSPKTDLCRRIFSVSHNSVPGNLIAVKEDVYSNLCRTLNLDSLEESQVVTLELDKDDYFPVVSQSVKISPLLACSEIRDEDEEMLLCRYFLTPKFLYKDDIFTVPINIASNLANSAPYLSISDVHFKVLDANFSSGKETESSSNNDGFYVLKGYSDLFCLAAQPSYLPIKAAYQTFLTNPPIPRISPDLQQNFSKLVSLIKPFTKIEKPACTPFFILSGTHGSGKRASLKLAANATGLHLITVNSFEFSSVGVSAAEAKLEYLLDKGRKIGPSILAVTGFEQIGRNKQGNEDARFVSSFLTKVKASLEKKSCFPQLFFGITDGKVDDILPNITRAALRVIKYPMVDPEIMLETFVLTALAKGLKVDRGELLSAAKKLSGYVHSDLGLLLNHAIRKSYETKDNKKNLCLNDLEYGLDLMGKAYSDTIGVAKIPDVKWDDVGGLMAVKEEIKLTLSLASNSKRLRRSGILFYGPPGTGKTLMAKAVATECCMNFLSVKGPELMNMYVGQSERNVREVFARGREAAPCILFFDELDSLAPNRGKSDGGGVTDRVVSQLLAEMDGLHSNSGLFIIAATNRPDLVDSALLRPGRFDKMFYLGPLVDFESKLNVLNALTQRFKLAESVDLKSVASRLSDNITGADIYSACSNAWMAAARRRIAKHLKDDKELPLEVSQNDFEVGISEMTLSLSPEDLRYYEQLALTTSQK